MTFWNLWTALSPIGGGLIALWGLLKLSPATFLERGFGHYLDKRLAANKQEHARQIESLKSDLAHLADRGVRSNEREFEALIAAWSKFMDAFYASRRLAGDFRTVPDFSRMSDEKARACLAAENVGDDWTEQIMTSSKRHDVYMKMLRHKAVYDAGNAIAVTRDVVRRQSVFMPPAIEAMFETAIEALQNAQAESWVQLETGSLPEFKSALSLLGSEGDMMFNNIRDAVRARLLRHSKIEPRQDLQRVEGAPE